jgi:hypothetical protein
LFGLLRVGLRFCSIPLQNPAWFRYSVAVLRFALPFRRDAMLRLAVHFRCSAKSGCSFPLPYEGMLHLAVAMLCFAMPMPLCAILRLCKALPCDSTPLRFRDALFRCLAPICFAFPTQRHSLLCLCVAFSTMPFRGVALRSYSFALFCGE